MSRGPDPLGGSEWSRHSQEWWGFVADDQHLPKWLRVSALALSRHGNNGHASFRRSEVAKRLGEPGVPADRRRVREWIAEAIRKGFLDPSSTSMCLVVRVGCVDKGPLGMPKETCRLHSRRAAQRKRRETEVSCLSPDSLHETSCPEAVTSHEESGSRQDVSRSGPISYLHRPQVTVTGRASTTEDREATA